MQRHIEVEQPVVTTVDKGLKLRGDILKEWRFAVSRVNGTPVQHAPVAMLRDAHVLHGVAVPRSYFLNGNGKRLRSVGGNDVAAMMRLVAARDGLVGHNCHLSGCYHVGIILHRSGIHAAECLHAGSAAYRCNRQVAHLSGLASLKIRSQRMPGKPLSLSNDTIINIGVPTTWSSGTNPQ